MSKPKARLVSVVTTLVVAALVPVLLSAAARTDQAAGSDDLKTQLVELSNKVEKLTDDNAKLADQLLALRSAHDEVLGNHATDIKALIAGLKDARQETVQKTAAVKKFVTDRNLRVVWFKWHGVAATGTDGVILSHDFGETVVDAVAGIVGFDQSFGSDDHHVQRLMFHAQVESIHGKVVNVRYLSWLHDNGDHRMTGNVSVLLLVHLAG